MNKKDKVLLKCLARYRSRPISLRSVQFFFRSRPSTTLHERSENYEFWCFFTPKITVSKRANSPVLVGAFCGVIPVSKILAITSRAISQGLQARAGASRLNFVTNLIYLQTCVKSNAFHLSIHYFLRVICSFKIQLTLQIK